MSVVSSHVRYRIHGGDVRFRGLKLGRRRVLEHQAEVTCVSEPSPRGDVVINFDRVVISFANFPPWVIGNRASPHITPSESSVAARYPPKSSVAPSLPPLFKRPRVLLSTQMFTRLESFEPLTLRAC